MPDFHEVRIRIRDEKLGQFSRDLNTLIPYAKIVGIEPIGNLIIEATPNRDLKQITDKSASTMAKPKIHGFKLSPAQHRIYSAIKNGHRSLAGISEVTGGRPTQPINNLLSKRLIIGTDGSYRLPRADRNEEVENG